jgi:hypothetical protein
MMVLVGGEEPACRSTFRQSVRRKIEEPRGENTRVRSRLLGPVQAYVGARVRGGTEMPTLLALGVTALAGP